MERIGCLSSVGGMKSIGDPGGAGRAESHYQVLNAWKLTNAPISQKLSLLLRKTTSFENRMSAGGAAHK